MRELFFHIRKIFLQRKFELGTLCLGIFLTFPCFSQGPLRYSEFERSHVRIGGHNEFSFYESSGKELSALKDALQKKAAERSPEQEELIAHHVRKISQTEAVVDRSPWKDFPLKKGLLNVGFNLDGKIFAGRFQIENDTGKTQRITLENNFPYNQAISLFEVSQRESHQDLRFLGRAGCQDFQGPQAVNAKSVVFDLELAPQTTHTFVLFYEANVLQMELRAFTPQLYKDYQILEETFIGFAVGFLFCVMIYNLFLWLSFRDRLYLVYCLFVSSNFMFVLTITGYLPKLIHDQFVTNYDFSYLPTWSTFLMVAMAIVFADVFNETDRYQPKALYFQRTLLLFQAICAVLLPFSPVQVLFVNAQCTIFLVGYMFYSVIAGVRRGNKASRIFLLAWCSYLSSGISNILCYGGTIEPNIWTEWGTLVGILIEGVGLSFAVGMRLKHQEDTLNNELQSALKAKVYLVQELVYRTTQPLTKITRAAETIQQNLQSWAEETQGKSEWPKTYGQTGEREKDLQRMTLLQLQAKAILTGIHHTENTVLDIQALSGADYLQSPQVLLKELWSDLMTRLHDSCTRTDLERITLPEDGIPDITISGHTLIVNLALEMMVKLWLASCPGQLYVYFQGRENVFGKELVIRIIEPQTPIPPVLLNEMLVHINFILRPYSMQMLSSPSGWNIQVCFYLQNPETKSQKAS